MAYKKEGFFQNLLFLLALHRAPPPFHKIVQRIAVEIPPPKNLSLMRFVKYFILNLLASNLQRKHIKQTCIVR